MAYLGSWKIDDYVPIPVTTHKFSTGAAFAPTSLTYSIYEDGGTTGIAEDVDMTPASPHDGVVGFYLARPQLTAAAGYEKGKNYTVLIKATVDSVAAIATHTFQIEAEVDANTVSGTVATVTNLTNLPTIPADWITAAGIKADAITEIQSGLATPTNITAGTITTVTTVTNGVALADDAITSAKFDESTAFPVKSADTGATQIARVGADSDTLETLSDQLDTVTAKTNLITTGTTITIASPVSGSTITAQRGDTLSAALENIGALTNNSKIWFTVKDDHDDADATALVQIEKTGGLLYINGAAAVTSANGTLTVDDIPTGDVTIVLAAAETAKLSIGSYYYDVQILRSSGTAVSTLTSGTFIVAADVTRAIS